MWNRYSVKVYNFMVANVYFRIDEFNLAIRNPFVQKLPCSQQPSIKEIMIETTTSGISNQLRYFIFRCRWDVASYKWKAHNGKIEIISLVVKFTVNFEVYLYERYILHYTQYNFYYDDNTIDRPLLLILHI